MAEVVATISNNFKALSIVFVYKELLDEESTMLLKDGSNLRIEILDLESLADTMMRTLFKHVLESVPSFVKRFRFTLTKYIYHASISLSCGKSLVHNFCARSFHVLILAIGYEPSHSSALSRKV